MQSDSSDVKLLQAKSILKSVFGFDSFRPLQQEIIESILNKQDATVIMPTGGGKSLCFQVPALVFPGLTIVVSPLISLMSDQVYQLHENGVHAAFLNSSLDYDNYTATINDILQGDLKILYMAPETLLKENTMRVLSQVHVDLLAIDEAHCVSEWGHDFRPEYRQISLLQKKLGNPVCIALTATATLRVRQDIIKTLGLPENQQFIASFDRKNLYLEVIDKKDSSNQILNYLQDHNNESGIIYCFSRKKVDTIYKKLLSKGHSVLPYHAGLTPEERKRNQEFFIKDEIQIMVATIAFGMGIDKPNVRFVIHSDLPKNMESYYQEIGRAGRDGLRSDCLLLFSSGDSGKIQHFIREKTDETERNIAHQQLDLLVAFANTHKCRRLPLLSYFAEQYPHSNCGMCDNCLNPKIAEDITTPSQKYLSCVFRAGQRFGANYIIDIILGSSAKRILSNQHDKLSTWGIGKELSKEQWKGVVQILLTEQMLISDPQNFNILTITQKGGQVLKGELKVAGILSTKSKPRASKIQTDTQYDLKLFEQLRSCRLELARHNGVAPYMIFNDKSLVDMCLLMPTNDDQFLLVNGVGKSKLEKYGSDFMKIIRMHSE